MQHRLVLAIGLYFHELILVLGQPFFQRFDGTLEFSPIFGSLTDLFLDLLQVPGGLFEGEEYPVTDRISRQGLYLPSGMALTESQLDQVCESVREVLV